MQSPLPNRKVTNLFVVGLGVSPTQHSWRAPGLPLRLSRPAPSCRSEAVHERAVQSSRKCGLS